MKLRTILLVILIIIAVLVWKFLSIFSPPEFTSTKDRLTAFKALKPPFQTETEILWNKHQVPYIITKSDEDAAFALGLVQAHLRLGQLYLAKYLTEGRVSEVAGPVGNFIDKLMRTIDYDKAVPEIVAELPPHTKMWLEQFSRGVNFYKENITENAIPHEFDVFPFDINYKWKPSDSIKVGRFGGTDVNWMTIASLMPYLKNDNFQEIFDLAIKLGTSGKVSFDKATANGKAPVESSSELFDSLKLITSLAKGSNSLALGPNKTKTGKPIIASDPHLGLFLPNFWMIIGLKSPSYDIIGMQAVATPVFAFGRNKHIAWGGTNLRSWSSDLYDITGHEGVKKTETIKTRFLSDTELELEQLGNVTSINHLAGDYIPSTKKLGITWAGHLKSDEMTAMLNISKAKNFEEFRGSLSNFSLPSQNFIYADKKGNVGHIVSTWLPKRNGLPQTLLQTYEPNKTQEIITTDNLPYQYNPERGYVASSNNNPTFDSPSPVGWWYNSDQRQRRYTKIFKQADGFTKEDMFKLQNDTYSEDSIFIRNLITQFIDNEDIKTSLNEWDGFYSIDSKGAYKFEVLFTALKNKLLEEDALATFWEGSSYLKEYVYNRLKTDQNAPALVNQTVIENLTTLKADKTWGDIHKVKLQHFLGFIPYLGDRYTLREEPVGGSQQTLMKTAHNHSADVNYGRYGSNARHISDLSDDNANYFALFGGQDGFISSENFADQVDLWQKQEYIKIPMDINKIRAEFTE